MDLNAIKAKLDALNNNGQQSEKTDYSTIFWKPEMGKQTVRIVPSAFDPAFPFKELTFHYGIGKYPMVALSNFGKQDPVEEFIKECSIPNNKVWAMPAGDTREALMESYPVVMDFVRDRGWRFTGRAHIIAFDTKREV